MRILYLHQYFNTRSMSGGTRSYEMARRLVAKGHKVDVITSWRADHPHSDWFETEEDGIKVHWLPVPYSNRMSYKRRMLAFARFATESARRAASIEADLVFATSTPLTIGLPAAYASWKQKIPMAFEVRDLWPELPIAMGALRNPLVRAAARKLEKWTYSRSEAIIALSPGMRDGIARAGFPLEKIAVIPNSSDNDYFTCLDEQGAAFRRSRPWLQEKPLLVYTGTFGAINGVGYMVDLAEKLKHLSPDIRILLIGDGQESEAVQLKARSAGVLDQNLFIEKAIPKNEIPALLNAANMASSLFIDIPEMRPNSANKFFDALAAGRPVLLNYGGWMHDLIQASGAGLNLWQVSIDEAAHQVCAALNDPAWQHKAQTAAKNLAATYFDRDKLAEEFEQVLCIAHSRDGNKAHAISPGAYHLPQTTVG